MELALALRQIWRHKLWLALAAVAGALTALVVSYHVTLAPPSIRSESIVYGAASTKVLLNAPTTTPDQVELPITRLGEQAAVYAQLLETRPVRDRIGRIARIPSRDLSIRGESGEPNEPESAQRSSQLISAGSPVSILFSADGVRPFIQLYGKAPTATQASAVVDAAVRSLRGYVATLERRRHVLPGQRVSLQQLGSPETGTLASGAGKALGAVAGLLVFGVGCLLILLIPRLAHDVRRAGVVERQALTIAQSPAPEQPETAMLNGDSGAAIGPGHRHLDSG